MRPSTFGYFGAPRDAVFQTCHFGEWLQGRFGCDGPLALITLMPKGVTMRARKMPSAQAHCHAIGHGSLSTRRLHIFLAALGLPQNGRFETRLPFAPGLGTGMSTATLIAIARLSGYFGPAKTLAQACIAAEGASDPLMYPMPDRVLWAPREGRKLGAMPALPRAHLLAGFFGPPHPTDPLDQDYDDISDLLIEWPRAKGLAGYAMLASESARRSIARRGPTDDPTPALARELGALGWTASHSGAARSLIFAPGTLPPMGNAAMRSAGLRGVRAMITGET